ncbi:hypothetical protein [uncultured phage MedDCM-OCT-S04-C1201]|nr:hypothetical protein [uncultured phage MedDCM-OCT-S04-C1201]ADD94302.1 hypothetical protein [uncultured phage MedDCM-OCT-S04-C695]
MTRDFFRQKVLGSKNYKGTTKTEFDAMSRSAQESMYKVISQEELLVRQMLMEILYHKVIMVVQQVQVVK